MTKASKKDNVILGKISYIYYLFYFRKDKKTEMWNLIDLGSKVNVITLAYAIKLGF